MVVETSFGDYIQPYYQNKDIRVFSKYVNEEDLIWHRDQNDRQIMVIEGIAWKLQKDNEKPIIMEHGVVYEIKAMEYHRIIKGYGNLVIKMWE